MKAYYTERTARDNTKNERSGIFLKFKGKSDNIMIVICRRDLFEEAYILL